MVDINGRGFFGVISVFFECKFKYGNFFVRYGVEYGRYDVFYKFCFLVVINRDNLFLVMSDFGKFIVFVDVD